VTLPAPHVRGAALVATAALVFSLGGLIARLVGTDAWTTLFCRGLSGGAFLGAVALATEGSPRALARRFGWPGLLLAVSFAAASMCFILALQWTTVANVLLLGSLAPYLTALGAWVLMHEHLRARTWVTMAVTLTGTVIMVSGSFGIGHLGGDLLGLGMALSFACGAVMIRRHPELPMAAAAALSNFLVCLSAAPMASPLDAAPRDLALLAFFGAGQLGLGYLLFTRGARLIPAGEATLIAQLETVLGPFWVWLALGERPGGSTLAGGALMMSALAVHAALDLVRRPPLGARVTGAAPR
jgi:drug/metabolite transporter (DMT)-like permease